MKKLVLFLFLLSLNIFADIKIQLLDFKGDIFLNNKKIIKKKINIAGNDTLIVSKKSKVLLLLNNTIKVLVIDSSKLILNDLFLELKTGMIRVKIPEDFKKNFSVKTKELVTSTIQNTSSYDFSIRNFQDSLVFAVYKGDSLKIMNYSNNSKGLSNYFYLSESKKFVFINGDINKIDKLDINRDFSSFEDKISFISNLYNKLDINECKFYIKNLLKYDELNFEVKKDLLFKLSYLYCFDNDFENSKQYLKQLLILDNKISFDQDTISPKFYKIYEEVKKEFSINNNDFIKKYSLGIIPGLYQLKNRRYFRGSTLLGINLLLLYGIIYEQNRQDYYNDLINRTDDRKLIFYYYDKSLTHYNRKKYFIFTELLLYSYNIFDIYKISKSKLKLKVSKDGDKILLSFNLNFY